MKGTHDKQIRSAYFGDTPQTCIYLLGDAPRLTLHFGSDLAELGSFCLPVLVGEEGKLRG